VNPLILLIHSPFLGPATWQPVARALEGKGRTALVPDLTVVARSAPPYWPAGRDSIVRAAGDEPVVLVPHSNAGLFVPPSLEALGDQVRGVAFVDAALPGTGPHSTSEFLRGLATVDGLLPPWTTWWDEPDVAALFPDASMREAVEAEQPQMPLAYYDHLPPAPASWAVPPCGYIWFGAPYDREAEQAARHGWPTAHVPGGHLHMLIDPTGVAEAVLKMTSAWT
jgi:pimeloyl-ACP methyl ester carboxylesterase